MSNQLLPLTCAAGPLDSHVTAVVRELDFLGNTQSWIYPFQLNIDSAEKNISEITGAGNPWSRALPLVSQVGFGSRQISFSNCPGGWVS